MKKAVLVLVAMALVPCCALAVDGVVLINSSTVMAAGGFPYIVSQPGSYKLSGNLTPPVNTNAINITASFVTLDLGGFTVSCSADLNQVVNCITDTASITNLAILNGSIKIVQPLTNPVIPTITITGINIGSGIVMVHDVSVLAHHINATALAVGFQSLVRHNIVTGILRVGNASLIVENLTNGGGQIVTGPNSKLVNNIP